MMNIMCSVKGSGKWGAHSLYAVSGSPVILSSGCSLGRFKGSTVIADASVAADIWTRLVDEGMTRKLHKHVFKSSVVVLTCIGHS